MSETYDDAASTTADFYGRLTNAELNQHIEAAEAERRSRREHAKATLREKFEELVANAGLSLDAALAVIRPAPAAPRRKPSKGNGAPKVLKYRNPETGQMWSGRGHEPGWIKGRDRTPFLAHRP